MKKTRVGIVYQIDPAGPVTGGIDSVIRGEAKWAPADVEVCIIGLSSDPVRRPPGQWVDVDLGGRSVRFLPVGAATSMSVRKGIPLSVRLTWGVLRHRAKILAACDVLEFHRMEAALGLLGAGRGRTTIVHQNMQVLRDGRSDMGWKRLPSLFFALERRFLHTMDSVFCVRSDACEDYRRRFPAIAERFSFLPTWMDTDVFFQQPAAARLAARNALLAEFGFAQDSEVLVAVGRLDHQKNPLLLLDAFALLLSQRPNATLVMVGDGVLRAEVERRIAQHGLQQRVRLAGLRLPGAVARLLCGAHLYVMSSAYEGMPISVLEAMACGLPVVSTRVGEVARVVTPGRNGILVDEHQPGPLADAMSQMLGSLSETVAREAIAAAAVYVPHRVLQPLFQAHRNAARRLPALAA